MPMPVPVLLPASVRARMQCAWACVAGIGIGAEGVEERMVPLLMPGMIEQAGEALVQGGDSLSLIRNPFPSRAPLTAQG